MSYSVEYEPQAITNLTHLTPEVRDRIIAKIEWLADNFEKITPQSLQGNLAGFYKLRVGDYRIIYDFDVTEKVIIVDKIGHRKEIYD